MTTFPREGYQLTHTAVKELDEILRFIASRDGLERALHVHDKFVHTFETLVEMPRIGRERPTLTGNRVRWYPVFRFAVIYDPATSPLTILRVIHGARDLEHILGQDPAS